MNEKSGTGAPTGAKGLPRRVYDSTEWRSAWLRSVDAAREVWNKLPYNDLANTGGNPQKLIALLRLHYQFEEGEARRQVEEFLRQSGFRT